MAPPEFQDLDGDIELLVALGDGDDNEDAVETPTGHDQSLMLHQIYNYAVHWRRNIFLVPYASAGNSFVEEVADLIAEFADESGRRSVASIMVVVACQ